MLKKSITLELSEDAKKKVPQIMKDLGIKSTEYSTKPKERLMLWGGSLSKVNKIIQKLKSRGFSVERDEVGVTSSEIKGNLNVKRRFGMPGLDGTGPYGGGPMTGGGQGICKIIRVVCPGCGEEFDVEAGMEEQDGWKGIRPENYNTIYDADKVAQDTTFPVILKHNKVRVPELKGEEIGEVTKVYMDGSFDVKFPSDGGEIQFVDVKKGYSIQKVGLNVGDRLNKGRIIKKLHANKEVGVFAATIVNDNGVEEVVVLEDVKQI